MSDVRLADYLDHIIQAITLACSYVEGVTKEQFLADKRTQQAVILNIMIIGEAATKLLNDHSAFMEQHAEVPWRNMRGMRNRLAHGYFDINLEVVWETVRSALPDVLRRVSTIRESL